MEISLQVYMACLGQIAVIAMLVAAAWYSAHLLPIGNQQDEQLLIATILFLTACVVLSIGLGLLGLLRPLPVFLTSMLLFLICWLVGHRRKIDLGVQSIPTSIRIFSIGAILAGVLALPFLLRTLLVVPVDWDSLTYHLFKPARWIQEGKIIHPLGGPYPYHHLSFYPANNEVITALFMVVLRNDLFAEVINLPLIAMTGVATGALCRRIGGTVEAAWGAGLLVVTIPALLSWGATAYVEPMLNVTLLSAILFTVCSITSSSRHRWHAVIMAGLAAGLAVGTKYSALLLAIFLGGGIGILALLRGLGWSIAIKTWMTFAGATLLTGGFWCLKNTLTTGNPFYPVPVGSLPAITNSPFPWEGSSILSNFRALLHSGWLWDAWIGLPGASPSRMALGWKIGLSGPLIFLGLAYLLWSGISSIRKGAREEGMTRFLVFLTACLLLYTYFILPFYKNRGWLQANVRFIIPFFCVGTAAGAACLSRTRMDARGFFVLALAGMALDARFLDLSIPGLPSAMGRIVLLVIAILGVIISLQKIRLLDRRVICAVVIIALLVLPLLLLHRREALRYAQYQFAEEVHPSQHVLFARAARFLQEMEPGKTLAVSSAGPLEFLYLFVGPHLERRVLYVETHAGPKSSSSNPTGDPRFAFDRTAWVQHISEAHAELLLTMRWRQDLDWPPEYYWAFVFEFPLIYQDAYTSIFTVPPYITAAENRMGVEAESFP